MPNKGTKIKFPIRLKMAIIHIIFILMSGLPIAFMAVDNIVIKV